MLLEHIEHCTAPKPDACIIWLHGLGADGNDFAGIIPELHIPSNLAVRFIFPHAPYRPVTLNNHNVMRAWYDVANLDLGRAEDNIGIMESAEQIHEFIEHQVDLGIRRSRIFLVGFSQGGAIALYTGLRQTSAIGGIMALSTYLPLVGNPIAEITADRSLSVFLAHGRQDDVVKFQSGTQSRDWLVQQGFKPQWHEYDMSHSVSMEEITDMRQWLIQRLQS